MVCAVRPCVMCIYTYTYECKRKVWMSRISKKLFFQLSNVSSCCVSHILLFYIVWLLRSSGDCVSACACGPMLWIRCAEQCAFVDVYCVCFRTLTVMYYVNAYNAYSQASWTCALRPQLISYIIPYQKVRDKTNALYKQTNTRDEGRKGETNQQYVRAWMKVGKFKSFLFCFLYLNGEREQPAKKPYNDNSDDDDDENANVYYGEYLFTLFIPVLLMLRFPVFDSCQSFLPFFKLSCNSHFYHLAAQSQLKWKRRFRWFFLLFFNFSSENFYF